MLSAVSLIAVAVIVAAVAAGWSKRFLASGALVIANIVVYVLTAFGPHVRVQIGASVTLDPIIHWELGLRAGPLFESAPMAALQVITSMFVHFDFMHLLGNLIVLIAFAVPFEERIGHRAFLGLYFLAGLVGTAAQTAFTWGEPSLLMGASGAVFGVIGAFAAMYPRQVIVVPMPIGIMFFLRMRVLVAAVVFTAIQFLFLFISAQSNTAYMAHIGGLLGGFALASAFVKVRGRPQKSQPVAVAMADLAPYAPDAATRAALDHMEASRDEPEVFQAWWERFWKGARDPSTGQHVRPVGPGRLMREDGTVIQVGRAKDTV